MRIPLKNIFPELFPSLYVIFDYDETIARLPIDWQSARVGFRRHLDLIGLNVSLDGLIRLDEMEARALDAFPEKTSEIFIFRRNLENSVEGNHFLYRDVDRIIQELSGISGASLFVVSNNLSQTVRSGLEHFGLLSKFEDILGIDSVGAPKPSTRAGDILAKKHGVIPQFTYMVGDSPSTDGVFSDLCGFNFININKFRPYEFKGPTP